MATQIVYICMWFIRVNMVPYPYVKDILTKLSRLQQQFKLITCRILLEYYSSDVAVSFFQKLERQQIDLPKRHIGSHRNTYLPSYMTCSSSVLNVPPMCVYCLTVSRLCLVATGWLAVFKQCESWVLTHWTPACTHTAWHGECGLVLVSF